MLADAADEPAAQLAALVRHTAGVLAARCAIFQVAHGELELVAGDPLAAADPQRAVREGGTIRDAAPPALLVPVFAKRTVAGVLALQRHARDAAPFEDADVDFVEQLAAIAALALANTQLVGAARERAARLELVTSLTREFSRAAGSYQQLLDVIVRRVGETLADSCAIRMVREDRGTFESTVAVYNVDPALAVRHAETLRDLGTSRIDGLAARAIANRAAILIPRIPDPEAFLAAVPAVLRPLVADLALASIIAAPIFAQDAPLAVVVAGRRAGRPAFTEADRQLVEDLASHAAIAITNARLLEQRARTAERLRLLTDASAAFAAGVEDPRGVLETVAGRLSQLIGGLCAIDLGDGDVVTSAPEVVRAADPDHVIELPVRAGPHAIGTLTLSRGVGTYTDEDRRFAQELVAHAALAIRNSRLLVAMRHELAERERAEAALRHSDEMLRHAQKMEAIGRLAGGIAHDFNNLLSVVLTSSALILETDPDPEIAADVAQIHQAGERAAQLTRQLLAFSRLQPTELAVLDLNERVLQVRALLERLLGEDIALETRLASDAGAVTADATQLEQILMNLAVNARDAMPHGGTLSIATELVTIGDGAGWSPPLPAGRYARLTVADTGEGMSDEVRERAFEPFFTTKPRGKGTGLGLATVFGIVTQHRGAIRVRSELGRGTAFEILLPHTAAAPTLRETRSELGALRGTESVLVVEDEDAVRRLVVEVLARSGYRVVATRNGAEALETFARLDGRFDLVMTDVVMPVMSGGELARRLRVRNPGVRVLYVSGYPDDATVHHHWLEPGCALLQKPIRPVELLRKVREVLAGDAPAAG